MKLFNFDDSKIKLNIWIYKKTDSKQLQGVMNI